jgi:hypothetical protein
MQGTSVAITENSFAFNTAQYGGAASFESTETLSSLTNTFSSNVASGGGGVMCSICPAVIMSGDSFDNNTASGSTGGGALWLSSTSLQFVGNTVISMNRAPWGMLFHMDYVLLR